MIVIANNTLRDSVYGMVFRVSVGAVLSTIDATTDIYVISTYYQSDELVTQANALLAMIVSNMVCQLLIVLAQYKNASWGVKLKEVLISLLFMRPAVDAYRVSTNYKNEDATVDPLAELMFNKCSELALESIPGCILQVRESQ